MNVANRIQPTRTLLILWLGGVLAGCGTTQIAGVSSSALFRMDAHADSRWASFENPTAAPGAGGMENSGAKGHAFDWIAPGETKTLLDVQGAGVIQRMWMTVDIRDARMLRALRLEMFWDDADKPAVSVPVGDFFGAVLGRTTVFENALFSSPEARSFVFCIPMPFRKAARVTVTNESQRSLPHLFYDINFTRVKSHARDTLYFHAHWHREQRTELGRDFEILPRVEGEGRFLGCHLGVNANPELEGWWGEGEMKAFLDGDTDYPTLAGTGLEDYIGTGWGLSAYVNRNQGCWVADGDKRQYTFYRYHLPDPIYFHRDCRVTIQQIGGSSKKIVQKMLDNGAEIQPVSVDFGGGQRFIKLLERNPVPDLNDESLPEDGWVNFYRRDDYSAVAFFYLDTPTSNLPPLLPVELRVEGIERVSE